MEAQGTIVSVFVGGLEDHARAVADRALVMERGRLVHAASRAELAGNDPAIHRYLAV